MIAPYRNGHSTLTLTGFKTVLEPNPYVRSIRRGGGSKVQDAETSPQAVRQSKTLGEEDSGDL